MDTDCGQYAVLLPGNPDPHESKRFYKCKFKLNFAPEALKIRIQHYYVNVSVGIASGMQQKR